MKTIDLYVNNDDGEELHYKVAVAESDEDRKKGCKDRTNWSLTKACCLSFQKNRKCLCG